MGPTNPVSCSGCRDSGSGSGSTSRSLSSWRGWRGSIPMMKCHLNWGYFLYNTLIAGLAQWFAGLTDKALGKAKEKLLEQLVIARSSLGPSKGASRRAWQGWDKVGIAYNLDTCKSKLFLLKRSHFRFLRNENVRKKKYLISGFSLILVWYQSRLLFFLTTTNYYSSRP